MALDDVLAAALELAELGYSVVPVATDGSKAPLGPWKQRQTTAATPDELRRELAGAHGIGVICGAVSGGLEMLELEGRAIGLLPDMDQIMADNGQSELWTRIKGGWAEMSPSFGMHWHYRIDGEVTGNTKIARRPATADELAENAKDKVKVLIETRGQGGFTVVAPSGGPVHPTGQPWRRVAGGPATCPTLTSDERDTVHLVLGMLDQMPAEVDAPRAVPRPRGADDPLRPGDDFNARADWADILGPHGWVAARHFGGRCIGWRRPGKSIGISATTGRNDGDNLYVFSSATDFPTEVAISKFAAYTQLEHHGDYAAAARELRRAGYGAPIEPSRPAAEVTPLPPPEPAAQQDQPPVDGNLALLPQPERPHLTVVDERTLDRSDDGNALLLVDRFGEQIRYCHDRGKWLAWDGHRWQWCERGGGVVRELAKRVARALPEEDKAALAHKRRSLGAVGTTAMLTQAATDERICVSLTDLDAHPWELNTPGGIVDLRTGRLGPADPAKLHTRITSCAPDPAADTSRWAEFLEDTFGGDQVLITYLQRLVGYSAVGMVGAHVLPFCFGSGGNGKGAFLEAVQKVLGDYATTAPAGFLMASTHAKHETDIARLSGARMVLCSEVNEGDRFDEAKVKLLTGGDTLTARFMQQDHFTFTPTHQLWLMGNTKPEVRSGGRSFWRRLRLIPFEHEVPEDKVVDDLQGILSRDHGPALLAWVIAGAAAYADGGLRDPDSVRAATADYAHDQDTVTRFLEEACRIGGGTHVRAKVTIVRGAYERWCLEAGEQPVTAKAFGLALKRLGVESVKGGHGSQRFYVGMSLLGGDDDAPPADGDRGGW